MSDARHERIELRTIRAWGHHGANEGEQDVAQPFEIDLTIDVDVHCARTTDALADTIDYTALYAMVVEIVGARRFRLLERLGEVILEGVMREPRIAAASISIAKPALLDGATPVVTLSRVRD